MMIDPNNEAAPSPPPMPAATPATTPTVETSAPAAAPNNDVWNQDGWRALPARAYRVFFYVALLVAMPLAFGQSFVLYHSLEGQPWRWPVIGGVWVAALALAWWVAYKRYRHTFWKLDADGFAVRRGRMWQWETRVPTSRVQHLDLKRGPIERQHRLASLVLHTAGTRLSAVSISGLDEMDAERLRDHFSSQIDRQDDDDHA